MSPQVSMVSVNKLRPNNRNARTPSKNQLRQIADSIQRFGRAHPLLIDVSGTIPAAPDADERNAKKSRERRLRFHAPSLPPQPIVAGAALSGEPINFVESLFDEACQEVFRVLFGTGSSADLMLEEFRKATRSYYYGHRRSRPGRTVRNPGMLTACKAGRKKTLRRFVHLAYRGDPHRRGVRFWGRIAALLWETHRMLMALRQRAERAKRSEIDRIAKIPALRANRADYMRGYRKRPRR